VLMLRDISRQLFTETADPRMPQLWLRALQ